MESKFILDSMTIQGLSVMVVVLLKALLDLEFSQAEVETVLTAIVGAVGAIMVFLGRIRAEKPLRLTK